MEKYLKPTGSKSHFEYTLLLFLLAFIMGGCQTQRNVVKSQDGKLSVDKETVIKDLNSIIHPHSELTIDEKSALLKAIKDHEFQDAEVNNLIIIAENALNDMAQEPRAPKANQPAGQEEADSYVELENMLTEQFRALINPEADEQSNDIILETLNYFESNDAPVLIILQELNGKIFYDRPTTIEKYLYYLKDLKKNYHQIEEMNLNNNDKINKLVLASQ